MGYNFLLQINKILIEEVQMCRSKNGKLPSSGQLVVWSSVWKIDAEAASDRQKHTVFAAVHRQSLDPAKELNGQRTRTEQEHG